MFNPKCEITGEMCIAVPGRAGAWLALLTCSLTTGTLQQESFRGDIMIGVARHVSGTITRASVARTWPLLTQEQATGAAPHGIARQVSHFSITSGLSRWLISTEASGCLPIHTLFCTHTWGSGYVTGQREGALADVPRYTHFSPTNTSTSDLCSRTSMADRLAGPTRR